MKKLVQYIKESLLDNEDKIIDKKIYPTFNSLSGGDIIYYKFSDDKALFKSKILSINKYDDKVYIRLGVGRNLIVNKYKSSACTNVKKDLNIIFFTTEEELIEYINNKSESLLDDEHKLIDTEIIPKFKDLKIGDTVYYVSTEYMELHNSPIIDITNTDDYLQIELQTSHVLNIYDDYAIDYNTYNNVFFTTYKEAKKYLNTIKESLLDDETKIVDNNSAIIKTLFDKTAEKLTKQQDVFDREIKILMDQLTSYKIDALPDKLNYDMIYIYYNDNPDYSGICQFAIAVKDKFSNGKNVGAYWNIIVTAAISCTTRCCEYFIKEKSAGTRWDFEKIFIRSSNSKSAKIYEIPRELAMPFYTKLFNKFII